MRLLQEKAEKHISDIDEYLRNDPFSLAHALERLRRAIHYEELEWRGGEDWSIAKNYVRLRLRTKSLRRISFGLFRSTPLLDA
jgi:hypothetical protein